MKVIFLDIDGVLATWASLKRQIELDGMYGFQKECVDNMNELIEKSGAEIVLSSTWRFKGLDWFNPFAKKQGLCKECIDVTGHNTGKTEGGFYTAGTRGSEIKEWLSKHPEVDSFVIIDDDSDMDNLKDHLVLVKPGMEKGFQKKDIEKALYILGEKEISMKTPDVFDVPDLDIKAKCELFGHDTYLAHHAIGEDGLAVMKDGYMWSGLACRRCGWMEDK